MGISQRLTHPQVVKGNREEQAIELLLQVILSQAASEALLDNSAIQAVL